MHAAVIKLNTLADAVGTTADHQDLVAIGWRRLALLFIGGVHIRGGGGKLGGAGVHPLVDRAHPEAVAVLPHLRFRHRQQHCQPLVREALALEREHAAMVDVREVDRFQAVFRLHQVLDLYQEPGIDARVAVHVLHRHAGAEGIRHVPDTLRLGIGQFGYQLLVGLGAVDVDDVLEAS